MSKSSTFLVGFFFGVIFACFFAVAFALLGLTKPVMITMGLFLLGIFLYSLILDKRKNK